MLGLICLALCFLATSGKKLSRFACRLAFISTSYYIDCEGRSSLWALIHLIFAVIGSFFMRSEIEDTMSAFAGGLPECLVHAKKFSLASEAALSLQMCTTESVSILWKERMWQETGGWMLSQTVPLLLSYLLESLRPLDRNKQL